MWYTAEETTILRRLGEGARQIWNMEAAHLTGFLPLTTSRQQDTIVLSSGIPGSRDALSHHETLLGTVKPHVSFAYRAM